jgi:RNA polymerase sigma factor (sigma-70 family)
MRAGVGQGRYGAKTMSSDPDKDTSITLMMRVQQDPADPRAWAEFVERYEPVIRAWCLRWGSQPSDADDVVQQVLLKLLTAMKQFRHQPDSSFRGRLKAVTHHAWLDLVDCRCRSSEQYGGSFDAIVDSHDALADLENGMHQAFARELLELAMRRVEGRVEPSNWEAFRLTSIENRPGAEAPERLKMPASHVFVAKHRVLKLLEAEIRRLRAGQA